VAEGQSPEFKVNLLIAGIIFNQSRGALALCTRKARVYNSSEFRQLSLSMQNLMELKRPLKSLISGAHREKSSSPPNKKQCLNNKDTQATIFTNPVFHGTSKLAASIKASGYWNKNAQK
jgi:hypothetical protein